MQAELNALREQVQHLTAMVQALREENAVLKAENKLLRDKNQLLLKRLFGKKSEKLSPAQLELLLGLSTGTAVEEPEEEPEPSPSSRRPSARQHSPRLPEHLPVEEVVIDPEEVKARPEAYRLIGEEVTEELDVNPARYFRRRIIRRKYAAKEDRTRPPVIAPAAPRLIEGGYASPGLLADIVVKKYVDHLPLYRQEQILQSRYGIELSRKTMCDWVGIVADWLKPICEHIRTDLRSCGYLQVDETPVRYCRAKEGGSKLGYFWVYHHPGSPQVLYEWHTSRAAKCLEKMCGTFKGTLQSDGYGAYASFTQGRKEVELAGCWAHVRRKFHEAREEAPKLCGGFLDQIGQLYRIEGELRTSGAAAEERKAIRGTKSRIIVDQIGHALKAHGNEVLPRSLTGGAIAYTLGLWPELTRFVEDGRLEIDNNLVENAIRPTVVGKKNWLFVGHPEAGERSAILYTILETCKRLGLHPGDYLRDVLTRLPAMKIAEVGQLTPVNWAAERTEKAA
jgi:transposase